MQGKNRRNVLRMEIVVNSRERSSGILMPVFSLPGKYGIGTLGKPAYDFVNFLKRSGQTYWQILPIGHTRNGSPYEVISAFAGSPYLIDLDLLTEEHLLEEEDLEAYVDEDSHQVNYQRIFSTRYDLLKKAWSNFFINKEFYDFKSQNQFWVNDYALFMAINRSEKVAFGEETWLKWEKDLIKRKPEVIEEYTEKLEDEMKFYIFVQYLFFKQWKKLKEYANDNGIKIIGDIPIYVSLNSIDVWVNPKLFKLDNDFRPIAVSGCPPDQYSMDGQYWGHALYDWDSHKATGFKWWIQRLQESQKVYDMVRLDHFIGFERYWQIPYGENSAKTGCWMKGPGEAFFEAIKKEVMDLEIVVEDLGDVGEDIISLRDKTGFKGMKVIIFACDSRVPTDYFPHNYDSNCIVYTSLHDTETVVGWMKDGIKEDTEKAINYFALTPEEGYEWGIIRAAWSSVGAIAIAQLQDVLGLDNKARMNKPPFLDNNWTWRMDNSAITSSVEQALLHMTKTYQRI
jgi:4-alpha-glucanotransferase